MAQGNAISVSSFSCDDNDVTAQTYPQYDKNNQKCALIVVKNVDAGGFKFHFNNAYFKVEEKTVDGKPVYWVYVQEGAKSITISNADPGIGPLSNYYFPQQLKRAKTYIMELGQVFRSSKNGKQYLMFHITPPNASLEVEGEPWKVEEGGAEKLLPFGTYSYKVSAPNYHTDAGQVVVNDPKGRQTVTVNLLPNFGWLKLEASTDIARDADVFIDGANIPNAFSPAGQAKSHQLSSGTHTLKIVKKLYRLFEQEFTVKDGETVTVAPTLVPNFAATTLTVANGADIYIDGVKMGTSTWSGPLEKGEYLVECRKAHHRSTRQPITVATSGEALKLTLAPPTPITGSLSVESTPREAEVTLDGRPVGTTPLFLTDILEGDHEITVSKIGHQAFTTTATVKENDNTTLRATLSNICNVAVTYSPSWATLRIDGTTCGSSGRYDYTGTGGYHTVTLSAGNRYRPMEKKVAFGTSPKLHFALTRINARPTDFYLAIGASSQTLAPTATLGCHIKNFNVEAYYSYPTCASETLYWNYVGNASSGDEYIVTYLPSRLAGVRIGYGIVSGTKLKFTPQLGAKYLELEAYPDDTTPTCISATFGVRALWAFRSHFGVSLTPEFVLPVSEGVTYKAISKASSTIRRWGSGFNVNLSFVVSL